VPLTTIGSFVIIPDIVSSDNLFQANVLNEIVIHVPIIIGPLLAGVLISVRGTGIALFIDAASFWLAAMLLVPVIRSPNISSKSDRLPESIDIYASLLQSVRYVFGTPTILWITCAAFAMNVAAGWLEISLPLVVHRQLHETASFLGVLWTTYAIGTILGGFLSNLLRLQVRKFRMMVMIVVWGIVLMGGAVIGTSWSVFIGMGLAGFVFGPYPPMARTIMQTRVASEIRGRIFSIRSAFLGLGSPTGAFIAGLLNSILSPEVGLAVIGAGIILLGASMFLMFRAVPANPLQ
jgi:MFS family permease